MNKSHQNHNYAKLGDRLRQARQKKRLSKTAVANNLHLDIKQITAIEQGQPKAWDGTYQHGYINAYARLVNIELPLAESMRNNKKSDDNLPQTRPISENSFVISKLFTGSALGLVVVAILGYVVWQVVVLTSPPPLSIVSPEKDIITSETSIVVAGKTSENTDIAINGVSILTEPDGSFSVTVPLYPGANDLQITATNRLTKQTTVEKMVFADYQIDPISN